MKLCIVGGVARSLRNFRGNLIKDIRRLGHDVVALAGEPDPEIDAFLSNLGVTSSPLPLKRDKLSPISDIAAFAALRRMLLKHKPDTVFTYTAKPNIYGMHAARSANIARRVALVSGIGNSIRFSSDGLPLGFSRAVAWLYVNALNSSTHVIFQNPDDAATFQALGLRRPFSVIMGSGVDLEHFRRAPFPPKLTFLMVARIIPEKGVREYAAAAASIRAHHRDVEFVLAGRLDQSSASRGISKEEVARWVESGAIRYVGEVRDVRPYLEGSSVFVLPSYYREGVPRSILEALSVGRPVITTHQPGCKETVMDGENGFLVKPRSPESLEKAILKFINKPELLGRFGSVSRRLAEEKFDVRKINFHTMRLLGLL